MTSKQRLFRNRILQGVACVLALASALSLRAQVSSYGEKTIGTRDQTPSILTSIGIDQHLNESLPLGLSFTDDQGKQVQLGSYFGKKPAILALVYYQCPVLCSEELNGLTGALQMVRFTPGKDFSVIVISIDPSETTAMAASKKASYVKRYGKPETAAGWHFMTGTEANIDVLANAVGFKYVRIPGPDGKLTQFAHASGIQIITTDGKLAQYYMGVEYSPKDLLLGLNEASSNKIGSPVDNILTYCYHYDPQINKHSLIVSRVVQLGGALTLALLGGFMLVMFRRDYQRDRQATKDSQDNGNKVNG